jgi:transcriptional regulator with XRE-family HTH domain
MKAKELRGIRKRLGWSQRQVAEAVGVTANSVARWERGEMAIGEPSARLLKFIAAHELSKGK